MLIHVAQNGRMYELDCQGSTPVEVIHSALAALTGIPASDQMLICADTRLEASRPLSAYRLPSTDKRVFLFNRGTLLPDAEAPPVEELEPIELNIPEPPSNWASGHPLDQSPNPLLRALPSYERQFKYHLQRGQAIFRATQSRYDRCRRLVQEQQVQEMALETGCGNMGHYYNHICGAHKDFMEQFNKQHSLHSELISCFERDMERLKLCELHPSLKSQSPLRRTLIDCVKEPALRKWAHDCTVSHGLFASKVQELQSLFTDLQRSVEDLLGRAPDVDVAQLVVRLEESHKYIEEQTSILQSLSKDLSTVKKLVEDSVGGRLSSSLRPLDACAALDPMNEVHIKSHLPRVESCDRKLASLLDHVYECKAAMSTCVHVQLQTVAALQSRIRDLRNQLAAFREAMARQDEIFAELALVRRVASSYQACLAEVVRRKAFATLYLGQAALLAEKMAKIRDIEAVRREEFVQMHSPRYLPRDLLEKMGLLGLPSQCEVSVPAFDLSLLDIDARDLQLRSSGALLSKTFGGNGETEDGGGEVPVADSGNGKGEGEKEGEKGGEEAGKLEMENAWLRSELAAAMTNLYALQPGMEGDTEKKHDKGESSVREMASRMAETLRLKDAHVEQLQGALRGQRSKVESYEIRIRELETHLQGLQSQLPALSGGRVVSENVSGSVISETAIDEEHTKGQGAVADAGVAVKDDTDGQVLQKSEEDAVKGIQMSDGSVVVEEMFKAEEFPKSLEEHIREEASSSVQKEYTAGAQDAKETDQLEAGKDGSSSVSEGKSEDVIDSEILAEESTGGTGIEGVNDGHMPVSTEGGEYQQREEGDIVEKSEKRGAAELARQVAELQTLVAQQTEATNRAQSEASEIRAQLKHNLDLLSECQMNCAHMENRLHEAREEARTQRAAAERRAVEYSALRNQSVRLRGLLERLQRCLAVIGPPSVEALRGLATSLACPTEGAGGEAEGREWVRETVRNLAERSAHLSELAVDRPHLQEKNNAAELKIEDLRHRLNMASEVIQNLVAKNERSEYAAQLGRQKICFTRFQVHELAAFLPDPQGRYLAINRNCPNHFLSDESVALFRQRSQSPHMPCVVGQIVHIEQGVAVGSTADLDGSVAARAQLVDGEEGAAGTPGNPYSLPPSSPFAVITLAMVPDFVATPSEGSSEKNSSQR